MDVTSLDSQLDAVTVYAQGAMCTRVAKLVPRDGKFPTQVRVAGLPLSVQPGSLRARVISGPSDLRVLDVRPVYEARLPSEADLPEEQRALEQSLAKLAALELQLAQFQREATSLSSLRPSFPDRKKGAPPRDAAPPSTLALAELVEGELSVLHTRQLALERDVKDAREEVELHQRRLAETSSARRTERTVLSRVALIALSSSEKNEASELAVEYLVPGARWFPTYDLRLARSMASGTLQIRASVAQRTGEDWNGVKLSLSTANIERRTEVPELRSKRVGRSQPPPPRSGWRDPPPGLMELFAGYDAAVAPPSPLGPPLVGAPPMPPAPSAAPPSPIANPRMMAPAAAAFGSPPRSEPAPGGASRRGAAELRRRVAAKEALPDPDDAAPVPSEAPGAALEVESWGAPADTLLDYGRLALGGPREGARRGKLSPVSEGGWELQAIASASVRIDLLIAAATRSSQDARAVERLPLPPHATPVRQSAGSYDYRYDSEHRRDIPSDGVWHVVQVSVADVKLSPEYVAVPSMEAKVFRTLVVTNQSPHALLSGPVDITLGDEFLMTARLPNVAPHGEQRFGMGVEEAIHVARNTHFAETTGGLLGGASVLQHEIEVKLSNQLSHTAQVEVRERVPVSGDADIKVDEGVVRPAWKGDAGQQNAAPVAGVRVWRVLLKAGEQATLSAQYVIKLPADKVLQGGNRRV